MNGITNIYKFVVQFLECYNYFTPKNRFFLQIKEMVKEKYSKDFPDLGELGTDGSKSDGRHSRTHYDQHVRATVKKNEYDCGSRHKKESSEVELGEVDIGCLFT